MLATSAIGNRIGTGLKALTSGVLPAVQSTITTTITTTGSPGGGTDMV